MVSFLHQFDKCLLISGSGTDRVEETNNNSGDRVIDLSMGSKKPSERVSVSSGKREIFYTLLYSL